MTIIYVIPLISPLFIWCIYLCIKAAIFQVGVVSVYLYVDALEQPSYSHDDKQFGKELSLHKTRKNSKTWSHSLEKGVRIIGSFG